MRLLRIRRVFLVSVRIIRPCGRPGGYPAAPGAAAPSAPSAGSPGRAAPYSAQTAGQGTVAPVSIVTLRTAIKTIVERGAVGAGIARATRSGRAGQVLILAYHNI